jgi:lipopolysaccharide biosynthesis glycosyltransferase
MPSKGIVYIAIGLNYLEMAISSAMSVLTQCVQPIDIVIFTDLPFNRDCLGVSIKNISDRIKDVKDLSPDRISSYLKTKLNQISPFDQTLYLDSDVIAVQDISKIWDYCGDNIAIAPAYNPILQYSDYSGLSEELETYYYHLISENCTQYNTGVFLFNKSDNTTNVFKAWHNEWYQFRNHEGMAFNRLCVHEFEYINLPPIYNQFYPQRNGDSILIHYIGWCKKYLIK